jgi:hypothetical protein
MTIYANHASTYSSGAFAIAVCVASSDTTGAMAASNTTIASALSNIFILSHHDYLTITHEAESGPFAQSKLAWSASLPPFDELTEHHPMT